MRDRVEHQKLNQRAIEKWPFCFVFGVELGFQQTQTLIKAKKNRNKYNNTWFFNFLLFLILINTYAVPGLRLTPKTKPKEYSIARWFRFWCWAPLHMYG